MNENLETLVIKSPPLRPLRVPSGWIITKNNFYNLSPNNKPKYKAYSHDDGWGLFDFELIIFNFPKLNYYLDMGWKPEYNPNGKFEMNLVRGEDWESVKTFETRSLKKLTEIINDEMLRISLENEEYQNYPQDLILQNLRPSGGWKYIKNEFFDIEPNKTLSSDKWRFFGENLLYLEDHHDNKIRIEMGWFPAFTVSGSYKAELIDENLENPLLEEFSTKEKNEIVEYINKATDGNLKSLSRKRGEREAERRRQKKLQMQRNQKV